MKKRSWLDALAAGIEKLTRFLEKRVRAWTRGSCAAHDESDRKERLAAWGQMASVMGHEIRNPLAVISDSVNFIKTKLGSAGAPPEDAKVAQHIAIIESEVRQADLIINEVVQFATPIKLKRQKWNLNELMDGLLKVYRFPRGVESVKEFCTEGPFVTVDADLLARAVRKIIENGVEAMPAGGTITVATAVTNEGFVRMRITDTGSGISEDSAAKLFSPFFTTKQSRLGLGLASAKNIVDAHGGKLEAESALGRGTTMTLTLPRARGEPPDGAGRAVLPTRPPPALSDSFAEPLPPAEN